MQYIEPHQPNEDTRLEDWFIKEGIPGIEDGEPISLFDRVDLLCCKMIAKARQADKNQLHVAVGMHLYEKHKDTMGNLR